MRTPALLLALCGGVAWLGLVLLPVHGDVSRLRVGRKHLPGLSFDHRLIGMLAGAVITVLPTVIFGRASAAPMLGVVGALIGWGAVEHRSRSARRKAEREIEKRLPVIIEMLALAVSAGEAPGSALARICAEGDGMLVRTLRGAVSDLALGSTLVQALERVRRQLPMAAIDRLIDGISIGHERGTSLTDLLHAQAQDARERQRRGLIEQAAKNEVTMMIPVVFLIMPVTVLFALFPSFHQMTWSS